MIFRKRKVRWGRTVIIILVVVLISATGRMLWANGFLTSVHTGFHGVCKVVAHLPGVADIEIADDTAFISASSARGPGPQDGIYALPLKKGATLLRLEGAPHDFHPLGISLYSGADGQGLYLVSVNRLAADTPKVDKAGGAPGHVDHFSIDSFEVTDPAGAPALVAQGTIRGDLLTDPRDVAASGPGTFYVANGATAANPVVRWLQTRGVIAGSNILYFNGMTFKVAVDGLYGAHSLILANGGHDLIVAGTLSRNLTSFQREPFTGALSEGDSLSLPANPQMLSLDGQGDVLAAGIANLWNWDRYVSDPTRPVPSQVFRAALNEGVPASYDQVFGDDGKKIGGADVAVFGNGHLLIGSALDGRLLDCTMP
jgi:hypothetical protein